MVSPDTPALSEPSSPTVGKRVVPVGAVALLLVLCLAGVAAAAFHTLGNVYHGLGSSTGGGLGSGQPRSLAQNLDGSVGRWVNAGVYHLRDDGGWNQQCLTGWQANGAFCDGDWGSAPCRKHAWTEALSVYAWHPHGSPSCV